MEFETIEIKKIPRIWRIQGDVQDGDLSTLVLEIFWRIDWVDSEGQTINNEAGGMIKFVPTAELLSNFSNISVAVYSQIQASLIN
ncbi:hypothetical protein [Nostoc sp.]|uniref:hypothetical protein n=1 Tax=Nostoc sp. TaxID=1180 RepID=UPI002FFB82B9